MSQDLLKIAISAALEAAKEILKIYHSDDFEVQLNTFPAKQNETLKN